MTDIKEKNELLQSFGFRRSHFNLPSYDMVFFQCVAINDREIAMQNKDQLKELIKSRFKNLIAVLQSAYELTADKIDREERLTPEITPFNDKDEND